MLPRSSAAAPCGTAVATTGMERAAPIVACRVEAREGGASRALVAAEPLRAGQVVLEESPLLLVPHGDGGAQVSYPLVQLRAFEQQDKETRDRILALHSPTDGPRATDLREKLRASVANAGNGKPGSVGNGKLLSDEELELWLKVTALGVHLRNRTPSASLLTLLLQHA